MLEGLDCHIHTFYQRCGNETLTVPNIIRRAAALGLKKIAVTDHLNNFDRLEAFNYIRSDIEAVQKGLKPPLTGVPEGGIEVFFGVELNYMSRGGEFAYNEKVHEDFGFEVVIGGIHSSYTDCNNPDEIIDVQHEHFMKTLENPLVDVLVHPFWFPGGELEKQPPEFWENLILSIEDKYISAWAEASAANECAIEVNAKAVFFNPLYSDNFKEAYINFLGRLNDKGALFAVGSDAHDINTLGKSFYVEGVLRGLGVSEERIWEPVKE